MNRMGALLALECSRGTRGLRLCETPQPGSFERYQCIIVRGTGWQKDTLPATPICTGLQHDGIGRPSDEGCVGDQRGGGL